MAHNEPEHKRQDFTDRSGHREKEKILLCFSASAGHKLTFDHFLELQKNEANSSNVNKIPAGEIQLSSLKKLPNRSFWIQLFPNLGNSVLGKNLQRKPHLTSFTQNRERASILRLSMDYYIFVADLDCSGLRQQDFHLLK
jgi:hypothetical protein